MSYCRSSRVSCAHSIWVLQMFDAVCLMLIEVAPSQLLRLLTLHAVLVLAEGLDDDDEVLLVMAEQLGRFIPFVGGSDYAFTLLEPLETLATVEETTVRDKAILSLNVVLAALPPEHIAQYAWELLKRLGERDWFTSRTSACGLIARMCSRLPAKGANVGGHSDGKDDAMEDVDGPSRQEIFDFFQRLCSTDEVPMVRRSAAAALADIGTAMAGGALQVPSLTSPLLGANNHSDSKSDEGGAGSGLLGVDATSASESVPPAIPRAVTVNCASQDSGAYAAGQLLPLLRAFARDEQDGVRLLAVDGAVALLRLLNGGMRSGEGDAADVAAMLARFPDERQQVLAVVAALCTDRAWRVRWSVANRLSELADACGRSITVDHLLPRYGDLLIDAEAEVRTAAAYRVADVGRMVGRTVLLSVLVPLIHKLSEDQSEHVRAALSSVVLGVAPVLGTQATIESLLPLFLRLLKDTSPAVRLNIISKLEAVNAVIGLKMLSQSLLPAIQELSADKAWRVRQAIIEFTPLLAKQLGSDIFDSSPELTDLCMRWLTDPVFSVREAATGNLRKLAEVRTWRVKMMVMMIRAVPSQQCPSLTIISLCFSPLISCRYSAPRGRTASSSPACWACARTTEGRRTSCA